MSSVHPLHKGKVALVYRSLSKRASMRLFQAKQKRIYMDHAAATPVDSVVFSTMKPFFAEKFANPSALYKEAVVARGAVEQARDKVARALGAQSDAIYFTSGGTVANNLAILGIARKYRSLGNHIIIGKTEHSSVIQAAKQLEKEGFTLSYANSVRHVLGLITEDTVLISFMYANNEIGSIHDIPVLGRGVLKWRRQQKTQLPYLHTDACQAYNYLPISVEQLHVDALTVNSAKIYGPKGVGCLYLRKGVEIEPLVYGGGQESGVQSGTENVPAIVGFGEAITIANQLRDQEVKRLQELQVYFYAELKEKIPNIVLNGEELNPQKRLVNNLNISFLGCEGEQIVLYLDAAGVCCSSGSACSEDSGEPSHVLAAQGYTPEQIESSVRFSMGRSTTKKDIIVVVEKLQEICKKIQRNV